MLIIISGYEHKTVDETIKKLVLIARSLGSKIKALIPLPMAGGGAIHRRLLKLEANEPLIDAYQRLVLPSNVDLVVKNEPAPRRCVICDQDYRNTE